MYISLLFLHQHLNRLVVKADTATVHIPELDFEIPPHTQKGSITTVESILMQSVESLEKEQPVRKVCINNNYINATGPLHTVIFLTNDIIR